MHLLSRVAISEECICSLIIVVMLIFEAIAIIIKGDSEVLKLLSSSLSLVVICLLWGKELVEHIWSIILGAKLNPSV